MEIKDYCEHCDEYREYDLTSVSEKVTIDDKIIECIQVKSTCKICEKEIYVPSIEDMNLKVLDDKRRQLRGILSQEDIVRALYDSNLSIRDFSKEVGITEKTLARYLIGIIPTKDISDRINMFVKEDKTNFFAK